MYILYIYIHILYYIYMYILYIYIYIYVKVNYQIIKYAQTEFYVQEQVRKVDDNENSVFKHDRFLMSFQVFKSYTATIMSYILFDVVQVTFLK